MSECKICQVLECVHQGASSVHLVQKLSSLFECEHAHTFKNPFEAFS